MKQIKSGDTVVFSCRGFLENGQSIDLKEDNEPFSLVAGKISRNPLQQKISHALIGMEPAQSKDLIIKPQDAFGEHDPGLVMQVAKNMIPKSAKEGDFFPIKVNLKGKTQTREAILLDLDEELATIDFNHPFAGREMTFKITIVSVGK